MPRAIDGYVQLKQLQKIKNRKEPTVTIQKKSLISSLNTTKKAIVASSATPSATPSVNAPVAARVSTRVQSRVSTRVATRVQTRVKTRVSKG